MQKIKNWLNRLSFRTGVIFIILCIICYIISFAQILLPISATAKGILWVVFFGLAKTFQYSGIAVLGTAGINRMRQWWRKRKSSKTDIDRHS